MFVFLRNGERVELPEATRTSLEREQLYCLDSSGNVVRNFSAESVVMFSMLPWDFLWEAIQQWVSESETDEGSQR